MTTLPHNQTHIGWLEPRYNRSPGIDPTGYGGNRSDKFGLAAAEAVSAVEALVAGAVANGDVPANIAERGIAHHRAECLIHWAHWLSHSHRGGWRMAPVAVGRGGVMAIAIGCVRVGSVWITGTVALVVATVSVAVSAFGLASGFGARFSIPVREEAGGFDWLRAFRV